MKDNNCFVKSEEQDLAIFAARFLRSYRLLHFIACRILGDEVRAPIAVQNCWRTASHNPPRFDYEGAFRSWLARVLIDEALVMLRESQEERDAAAAVVDVASMANNTLKTRAWVKE